MMRNHLALELLNRSIVFFLVLLLIYSIKGCTQAATAYFMGDRTAKDDGFLTLNPLAHLNVMGLIVIVTLYSVAAIALPEFFPKSTYLMLPLVLGVQWAIPISLNPRNFKKETLSVSLVALSGPLALIFTAFLALAFLHVFLSMALAYKIPANVTTTALNISSTIVSLAIWFGLFDLLPIPPLDGGIILRQLLPMKHQHIADWIEEYALYILLFLFFCPGIREIFLGFMSSMSMLIKSIMLSLLS